MANFLPFLLIGGAIAYMTVGQKKNGNGKKNGEKKDEEKELPYLWISEDCSEVKVMGFSVDELAAKGEDPKFVAMADATGEAWGEEKLKLSEWFAKRPGIDGPGLEGLALEIAQWAYPRCKFTEEDLKSPGTPKHFAIVEIHALAFSYLAKQQGLKDS